MFPSNECSLTTLCVTSHSFYKQQYLERDVIIAETASYIFYVVADIYFSVLG